MDDFPETQSRLLARVKDPADQDAWSEFCVTYRSIVVRMCRRRGLQDADAEDLAQRVLESTSRRLREFEVDPERGRFRSWLSVVIRNAIIDHLRTLKPDRPIGGSSVMHHLQSLPSSNDATNDEIEREHRRQLFREAADVVQQTVDDLTWQAFQKTAVEHRAIADVAADLGLSIGSVYAARSRVMKRLREVVSLRAEQERTHE